jgi:hypothetical protein
MSESKFKTIRHIETVRNYLNAVVTSILHRAEIHDQSKLEPPEVDIFEVYTPKLRDTTYGSDEYKQFLSEMKPAIEHHNEVNRHHPEHFADGVKGMTLIDLIEMVCDWKAATMRHHDGDIMRSIDINQKRFGFTDELATILRNTAHYLNEEVVVYHKADES